MASLLKIDVSPRGDYSYSRQLGKTFLESWQTAHSGGSVVERDLAKNQPTFLDLAWIAGAYTPPDQHTDEHKAALNLSDEYIAEVKAADHILITTPFYNFSVPAVLKAWIDHVVRVGHTFKYDANGPTGLISGKKATVIVASGGSYGPGEPFQPYDFLTPYIKAILGFIGITDVTVLQAGGASAVQSGKITAEEWIKPYSAQAAELAKA
jgi:FMN-dependent NADH-azoreductase